MILQCPACGTQYAVKDGAIPAGGRQVRCAACKHSWHQDPEDPAPEADAGPAAVEPQAAPAPYPPAEDGATPVHAHDVDAAEPEAEPTVAAEWDEDNNAAPAFIEKREASDIEDAEFVDAGPPPVVDRQPEALVEALPEPESEPDYDFNPFAAEEEEPEPKRRWLAILMGLLLIAAAAAAFWFLAPAEWKARLGLAAANDTPLQLMMTHSDRQTLASGNELLTVSGRVINPTDELQNVPPIQAQLRSRTGQLVYSWTIAPPARTLAPRASRTFNSAEVSVPSGGDELTISLGRPKA